MKVNNEAYKELKKFCDMHKDCEYCPFKGYLGMKSNCLIGIKFIENVEENLKVLTYKLKECSNVSKTLEKALDNACEKLEYCSKERGVFNVMCDKQYWKERFMKEA